MKITLEIDNHDLRPFRALAKILGVPLSRFLMSELEVRARDICEDSLDNLISLYFADRPFRSRKEAEAVGRRLEEHPIERVERASEDCPSGTVATEAVPLPDGRWTLKISYLGRPGARWRSISVLDDDDEGEEWKE